MVQLLPFCTCCLLFWELRINFLLLQNEDMNTFPWGLVFIRLFSHSARQKGNFQNTVPFLWKVPSLLPCLTSKREKSSHEFKAKDILSHNCGQAKCIGRWKNRKQFSQSPGHRKLYIYDTQMNLKFILQTIVH